MEVFLVGGLGFGSMLYKLFFGPLELLFETVYMIAYNKIYNPVLSIIFLSICMNVLVLPLYKRADAIQREESEIEKNLEPWVKHIKKTFKGDERFMVLRAYYRQNNYKPTDTLKSSVSLLLQIPFFVAAYKFLSQLSLLDGVAFGPISNLGAPDRLLTIGSISINVLPLIMTAINLISGSLYSKGMTKRAKIQLYGLAVVFLILLYRSPAGLVFYWTLNNLFSLCKNIFFKLKNPHKALKICGLIFGIFVICTSPYIYGRFGLKLTAFIILLGLICAFPFIWEKLPKKDFKFSVLGDNEVSHGIFYLGALFLCLLVGILIPSAVLNASPSDFINYIIMVHPLWYLLSSTLLSIGTFILWFTVFYKLASPKGQKWIGLIVWILDVVATFDYILFGKNLGVLRMDLSYENGLDFSGKAQLINLFLVCVVAIVSYAIWRFKSSLVKILMTAGSLSMAIMIGANVINISRVCSATFASYDEQYSEDPEFTLSTTGQNVMIIMLDRGYSAYLPYILNEVPELTEKLSGFTYYENSTSFGGFTNFGLPAIFGGYDYSVAEINKRNDILLEDKHNEALLTMPVIFSEAGYETTIFDPVYAGYEQPADLSVFDDYPDIKAYRASGLIGNDELKNYTTLDGYRSLYRNLFCYGIMKASPLALQSFLYNAGTYNGAERTTDSGVQKLINSTEAYGLRIGFLQPYYELKELSKVTNITDEDINTFFYMCNDATHEPMLLQLPDYTLSSHVDNTDYEGNIDAVGTYREDADGNVIHFTTEESLQTYHTNLLVWKLLGDYMDFLREEGVYDNTKIIIVSDHGRMFGMFEDGNFGDEYYAESFRNLLLVKDFNETEFKVSEELMTTADVPTLATDGTIENPVNPFTGNPINSDRKYSEPIYVFASSDIDIYTNNGTTFTEGRWYKVHDDVRDKNNWTAVDNPNK